MAKSKKIVVDSDAIFALYNPNDSLHVNVLKTFEILINSDYQLVYPTSVLFEIITLFQRVLPTPTITAKLVDMIANNELSVYIVNEPILKESTRIFSPKGSKKNTLIDCSVVAIAQKIQASAVFSYDSFYTKQGLILASDLAKKL